MLLFRLFNIRVCTISDYFQITRGAATRRPATKTEPSRLLPKIAAPWADVDVGATLVVVVFVVEDEDLEDDVGPSSPPSSVCVGCGKSLRDVVPAEPPGIVASRLDVALVSSSPPPPPPPPPPLGFRHFLSPTQVRPALQKYVSQQTSPAGIHPVPQGVWPAAHWLPPPPPPPPPPPLLPLLHFLFPAHVSPASQ